MEALAPDVKGNPDKKACFPESRQSFLTLTMFQTLSQALTHCTLKTLTLSAPRTAPAFPLLSGNDRSVSFSDIALKDKHTQVLALTALHIQNMEITPSFL